MSEPNAAQKSNSVKASANKASTSASQNPAAASPAKRKTPSQKKDRIRQSFAPKPLAKSNVVVPEFNGKSPMLSQKVLREIARKDLADRADAAKQQKKKKSNAHSSAKK